jgi:hypothetical protein
MIADLFKVVNSNKGCLVSLSICSIVKGKALSNFETYSFIESALFTGLEGHYEMKDGLPGHSYYEGISKKGLLINLNTWQQLFISEDSKIEMDESEGNISFDIKDSYSSMHIKLQVLTKTKVTN